MADVQWPEPPPEIGNRREDALLEKYRAELDVFKSNLQSATERKNEAEKALRERQKEGREDWYAASLEVYKGYIEVAKGQIDRSIKRAEFVQTVAAGVASAYAAILALSFAVVLQDSDAPFRLPVEGILPTLFIGLSFLLSAAYVAYLTHPGSVTGELSDGTLLGSKDAQRNTFILWTRSAVARRRYLLKASVIGLGVGLLFMPAPYIQVFRGSIWNWVLGGVVVTFGIPALTNALEWLVRELKGRPRGSGRGDTSQAFPG